MLHPSFEEFSTHARPGALVPVYKEILADLETPVSTYMKLAEGQQYAFLFESVEKADRIGQYSFIGANPSIIFRSKGTSYSLTRDGQETRGESENPLNELRALMKQYQPAKVSGLPSFHGGAVGYMSYDQVRFFEKLPDKNPDTLNLPDLYFMITDTLVIFDHVNNKIKIVSNAHVGENNSERAFVSEIESIQQSLAIGRHVPAEIEPDEKAVARAAYDEAVRKIATIEETLRGPLRAPEVTATPSAPLESNFTEESFCAAVEAAKEYIRAGDIFQVVLSQRFRRKVSASPVTLYRALRCINPSPYMLLMQFPEFALAGSSPEVMTQVKNGTCMVRPIAGTRKRGKSEDEDVALEQDLLADQKEIAEHVMLVDLGRNDIGRVSLPGTVAPVAGKFMVIERYSHVMHIVSEVAGKLRPELDAFDALAATFPMGTVSGAPKIRAMEIIDELEPVRRGPYAGGCGYIGFDGEMDTCILIRTMVLKDGYAHCQAGAGLVYDSVPETEYEETVNKATALFRAVDFAEKGLES